MLKTIWERYFIKEFLRIFCLFLFCLYGLYILIDFASHTSALSAHHIQLHWKDAARYYYYVFAGRAEILIPLALLIAFVKTVCTLNTRQELVALMASGIKLKQLMRPFLVMGILCMFLLYLNEQYVLPNALKRLRRIEDATKHQKRRHQLDLVARNLILENGSLLIYQGYNTAEERFFDVYWIQSNDSIYRMKTLSPYLLSPKGTFVEHFKRNSNGEIFQEASYVELELPGIQFNPKLLESAITDPDILSITDLAEQTALISTEPTEKESKTLSAFYWKLVLPWLCVLAIIAPAPFCVWFSRQLPVFMIIVCSLFGLIAFYMFMDAAQVMAKRQVILPFSAILMPFIAAMSFFSWRFIKME